MGQKLLHYDVLHKLGEGAASTIYAVSDPRTRRVYALKHVVRKQPKDIRFIEQMQSEHEISKEFRHPNLRRSIELTVKRSLSFRVTEAFLLMELFDGIALDQDRPTDLAIALHTFVEAAKGLRAMHQQGVVHCDMKPNNVLRNDRGEVKVIDYGQSCPIGTVKQRIQGTPDFIAPEQVERRPVSIQTDLYNFGATLYWCVTGQHIPTLYTVSKGGKNSFLLDTQITAPIELVPNLPPTVNNFIMECIATSVSKRPPDMDKAITRLELGLHSLQMKAQGTDASLLSEVDDSGAGMDLDPDDTRALGGGNYSV